MLDRFREAGGNTIDTADVYSGGGSEELLGRLVAERGIRDGVVIATKHGFAGGGGPVSGGAGRLTMARGIEGSRRRLGTDHVRAAQELGLGIVPWRPLAGGFLSGKYHRDEPRTSGAGRLATDNPFGDSKFTDRNRDVLDVLREVADGLARPPAEVALAWVLGRAGVDTVLVGGRTPAQMTTGLDAADHALPLDARERLDAVSAPELGYSYAIFTEQVTASIVGGGRPIRRLRS